MAKWNVNAESLLSGSDGVFGICRFDEESDCASLEVPFGDISESRQLHENGFAVGTIFSDHYEYLFGITQDGKFLVLSDVMSHGVGASHPGATYEKFSARTVLSSCRLFDPSSDVVEAEFSFDGLLDWINYLRMPKLIDGSACMSCADEALTVPLYNSERCSVTLEYGSRQLQQYRECATFSYFAKFHLSFSSDVSLDDFWANEFSCIQSFMAFCFGFFPAASWMRVKYKGCEFWADVHRGTFSPQHKKIQRGQTPVPYRQLGDEFPNVFTKWLDMVGDEAKARNLFSSLLCNWKMPLDFQLFAANTMLEALSRANDENIFSDDDWRRLRQPILDVADASIRNRVQGLLELLRHRSYSQLLDKAYNESADWGKRAIPDWSKFKKEQCRLRNIGAHALSGERSMRVMIDHYYGQLILAYYILMLRLEMPETVMEEFDRSNFLNVVRANLKSHYSLED